MKILIMLPTIFVAGLLTASAALAACEGSNGRGWASGKGNGAFVMAARDKSCAINFPGFIDDATNTSVPASDVTLSRAPKNGKIGVTKTGVVYTPNAGFKGDDKFCTKNKAAQFKGKTLSGCVTVTVK